MSAPPEKLTCVVIALLGGDAAARCAEVLAREIGGPVAIVDRSAPGGATVPGRRRAAFAQMDRAQTGGPQICGPLVALVEDTTLVAPGWAAAVRAGLADPAVASVWGPVRIAETLAPRFRALGRLEYGRFQGAVPGGAPLPQSPPGNCMAFRRAALDAVLPQGDGFAEHQVAADLRAAGWTIVFAPGAASTYAMADRHGALLATRFGHGRLYAASLHGPGNRPGAVGGRLTGALKALLVPLVLTARAISHARAKTPARLWLAEAPHLVLMALAWGAGEFTGHLFGKGDSARTWR